MAKIRINDTILEYTEHGNGESLILVHGSASDYRTWSHQFEKFSTYFRTIMYSRRYHWPNKKIPAGADYPMPLQVDDLAGLIQTLEASPAHLVGHSYGAFICLLLAMQKPQLVRSLVLAEPPVITLFVSNTPKPTELLKLFFRRPRTAIEIIRLGAKGLVPAKKAARNGKMAKAMRVFGQTILGPKFYDQLSEPRHEQIRANTIKAELLGSGFAPLNPDKIRNIRSPALLMNGHHSPKIFHRLTDSLEELLPNTKRIQIPGTSHIMHEDNPAVFNREVISFLMKQQKRFKKEI